MKKVLNFGSLNIDYVYTLEHFVRAGETIASSNRDVFVGGKGLNQSIALKSADAVVFHAGAVGKADGDILTEALAARGVNIELVKQVEAPSGHAIIQLEESGGNSIILFPGANHLITEEQIDAALSDFSEGDYLVLQNEINNVDIIMRKAKQKGMLIVFNPSPMNQEVFHLPLELVDYFVLNEIEAKDILHADSEERLDERLLEAFPNSHIVLTLGKDGARYRDKTCCYVQDIYHVPVVDTTAAGDTFTGFFIGSISKGVAVKDALDLASRASALAVSTKGAANSIPTLEQVRKHSF